MHALIIELYQIPCMRKLHAWHACILIALNYITFLNPITAFNSMYHAEIVLNYIKFHALRRLHA